MTDLARKALAELIGTAGLVAAVIGSGIMATRLSPDDVGLQLLENTVATGAVLVALILTLQPVSAAFNPAVTLVERLLGLVDTLTATVLVVAQVIGGIIGAIVANLMFGLPAIEWSTHVRDGSAIWLGEIVATFGLVVVVFGGIRSGRQDTIAFAVGGYITAGYWFTSSTSFANPAVTIARAFSDTFAGISLSSVTMFVVMQIVGALIALAAVKVLYPSLPRPAQEATSHE